MVLNKSQGMGFVAGLLLFYMSEVALLKAAVHSTPQWKDFTRLPGEALFTLEDTDNIIATAFLIALI